MKYTVWLLTALVLISCGKSARENVTAPPNIIFLLTDDHRWDALGIMGHPILRTPNLDSLASEGVLFTNAYVTTSICAVSRASILTGQYMARHGIDDFQTSLSEEQAALTYPMRLKDAGYHIGFIGKYGVGNPADQPKDRFDFWAGSDKGQPDYEMTDAEGNYIHHTDKVGLDAEEFLDQWSGDKPFNLSVSFKAPHIQDGDPRQFIINPRYKYHYEDEVIPIPLTADPKYWESFPDFFRTDENIARERWYPVFQTPELYQENVKNYYRLITDVDDMVGRLVKKLKDMGEADNTVIIFMSDNGFYLGEHGLAGKWYGHEESVRVPLFIHDPRRKAEARGLVIEDIALNIDIAPTVLGFAGIEAPEGMQGLDLMALVEGNIPSKSRTDFYYEHTFFGTPKIPKTEGVISAEDKYILFSEHGYEQYFDLLADPHETINLATNPAYQEKVESLRRRHAELKELVK